MGDTSFVKYNHRILSINKGNTPDVLTESITVPSFRGYQAGEVIPAGTKLLDIITKEFKSSAPTHTITVQVVGQGSTNPAAGSHSVIEGNSFTMTSSTPASGWNLDSVKLDGASVTLPNVISNVTGDHTFVITFSETPVVNKYKVTGAVDGGNGSIAPTDAGEFDEGSAVEAKTFNATPDSGYIVDSWSVNGTAQAETGTSFTLPAISAIDKNYEVKVKFKVAPAEVYHIVIADATSGLSGYGTISPAAGTHDVVVGSSQAVVATPASGFKIKSFKVDSTEQAISDPTAAFTYTVSGVAADATVNIIVEFEQIPSGNIYNDAYIAASGRTYKESDIVEANAVLGTPAADPAAIVADMKGAGYAWHTHAQAKSVETFLIAKSLGRVTSMVQNGFECLNNTMYEKTFTIDGVEYWCYHNTTVGAGNTDYTIKGE